MSDTEHISFQLFAITLAIVAFGFSIVAKLREIANLLREHSTARKEQP